MPEAEIERLTHMASGDHHCGYAVRPKRPARSRSGRSAPV
jgi:hypothetical protein